MLTALTPVSCRPDMHVIDTERFIARATRFSQYCDGYRGCLHTASAFGGWDSLPTVTAGLVAQPLQTSGRTLQAEDDQVSANGCGGAFLAGTVDPATLCVTLIDCCLLSDQESGVITAFSGSHLDANLHSISPFCSLPSGPDRTGRSIPGTLVLPTGGTGVY